MVLIWGKLHMSHGFGLVNHELSWIIANYIVILVVIAIVYSDGDAKHQLCFDALQNASPSNFAFSWENQRGTRSPTIWPEERTRCRPGILECSGCQGPRGPGGPSGPDLAPGIQHWWIKCHSQSSDLSGSLCHISTPIHLIYLNIQWGFTRAHNWRKTRMIFWYSEDFYGTIIQPGMENEW